MDPSINPQTNHSKNLSRIKIAAVILTLFGICLFAYFVYAVGFHEIYDGVSRFGFVGFAVILAAYFGRVCVRATAWKLAVHTPYSLSMRDTIPAVIIGEAMSSTVPLGILISGTSKAVAVRRRIPLVAGLSSVATENLFYSLVTGIFLILGGIALLNSFAIDQAFFVTIAVMIGTLVFLLTLGILMVIRQWHFASEICEWVYRRGFLTRLLENGRLDVRLFENLIYGFYRNHPQRFIPISLCEASFHLLGIFEVWYILNRLSDTAPTILNAFLLESVSRLITIMFKLIPFMIGVDEAGAQFIGQTVALAAGMGVTLAIIRKGRILFWTAVGWIFIAKRGLTFKEISRQKEF